MMINDMLMLTGALVGGVIGGLLIMGAMISVVFVFDIIEKREKK